MKTMRLVSISILFTALCLVVTACSQGMLAGNDTGEVRVVIGGGAARSVNGEGLPVFDESNTTITVTDEDGNQLAQGSTSLTLRVGVNKKITVAAIVTTAAGEWRGSKEHTVTAGTNTVAVRLSKAPKSVGNILIDVGGSTQDRCTLKMESKTLVSNALINTHLGSYPITARDKIGRVYCLYQDVSSTPAIRHFKRFDVEGTEDTEFETTFMNMLSSHNSTGVTIDNIDTIAIDAKNNNIFLFYGGQVVCINETEPSAFGHSTLPASISSISAAAAYNGMVFFAVPSTVALPTVYKLFVCKAELSGTTLTLTKVGETQSIDKLRTEPVFGNNNTNCTGLFADESGVYCLLNEQGLHNGNSYALGKLIRCTYSGSTLTDTTEIGLNPAASTGDPAIAFDARYFSNPVGFIGYDEDYLYIADDGANFEYTHENIHSIGNKNRIAAVNRKTDGWTFSNTDATWYAELPEYKEPDTKVLLWEKESHGMNYWISETGTEKLSEVSEANKLFKASTSEEPTDQFCYDQDGNLYILWQRGSDYKVRRFELKDGSYKPGVDSGTIGSGSRTPRCIAVDISDGQNCLYYGNWDGSWRINKVSWTSDFTSLSGDGEITVPNITEDITALAVNKDGIFVDVKEDASVGTAKKYRLKVQKYAKTGSPTAPDSEITLVDDAPRYTKETGEAIDDLSTITAAHKPYIECEGAINGLQVVDGVLYAITSRITKTMKYHSDYVADTFSSGSSLYKVGTTSASFSGTAEKVLERPANDTAKIGYGFYRFIAIKPKKLVIASDSAWDENGIDPSLTDDKPAHNTDNVVVYDLGSVNGKYSPAGGSFSKQLKQLTGGCGFAW